MTPGEESRAASPSKSEVKSVESTDDAESTTETGETPKAGE